ncbi:MAG: ester cyclase, partial [Bacteroidota bacterium]
AWRIENEKIQEHWDALVPIPQEQLDLLINGDGNGEKEVSSETRHSNKSLVQKFMDHVFNRGQVDRINEFVSKDFKGRISADNQLQGISDLRHYIDDANGGRLTHDKKMIIASGDLVMAHSHYFGENERVVFDWFRVAEGLIVDHWVVSQLFTPQEEVANEHPHF